MKRIFDLLIASFALIVFSPLLLTLMLLVRWKIGSPVFFRQQRTGRYGIPFRLIKFRTMTDECDEYGSLLPDKERMTRLGRYLRAFSLDELPELWNVLRGDMSLVGPRPLYIEYLPLYSAEQARRHEVRPGITGWAQINGRNRTDWPERLRMDVWYVDSHSLWLDMKILLLTIAKVLRREGISADGHATMPPFRGEQ